MAIINYRSVPAPEDAREPSTLNERRFRAAVEEGFGETDRSVTDAFRLISAGASAIATIQSTYLPLAGGEMTGNLTLENTVALRLDDSGGSPQVGMRMTGADILQVGEVNVPNMELIAASAGTIEFYCGTANIDARVSSSKFESFGGGTLAFSVDAGDMWVGGTAEVDGNVTFNARMISTAAGSLAAPSVEFQGNTTTWGLDTTSGDDFRISRAGSNMLSLNSTGSTILSDFSATDGTAYAELGDQGLISVYRNTSTAAANLIRLYSDVTAANTEHFQVKADGDVLNTNNSYGAISDERLKENIADVPDQVADFMKLRVRRFNLKSDPEKTPHVGLIAQEVYPIQPRLVSGPDENGHYGVRYSLLGPMTVKVVQEVVGYTQGLKTQVDDLRARIELLEQ